MAKTEGSKKEKPQRRRRTQTDEADWSAIDYDVLRRVIAAITSHGGAVRFGYSRDGGAYSVGIYGDGKPFTEFCPKTEEVEGWLEGIVADYE